MKPLLGLMMNMMGMGCMPSPFMMGMNFMMPSLFCGCSNFMTMPYYRDDNLGFLNFPIMRDTSADFLLDPGFVLKRCKQNWQNGGGYFGSTILPGFTFPPIGALPGLPGTIQPAQKTEEERKAEEEAKKKKEAEAINPEAEQAKKYYEIFKTIKKLTENKENLLDTIPEELSKKAEEAMKKETAAEQLAAMKEVLSEIPADTLRKAVLADDKVKNMLRKAGYNFNMSQYSTKNTDIKEDDIDNIIKLDKLHDDIQNQEFNEFQLIAGLVAHENDAKDKILGIISTWNDKYKSANEKGVLRYIVANLPTGKNEEGKLLGAVKKPVKQFAQALVYKAKEYKDYPKIETAANDVTKQLALIEPDAGFTKNNIRKLAEACDKLYVRLRMQEAVTANKYLNENFGSMNDIHEGIITDRTVIEETEKDLKKEGYTPIALSDLDNAPERQQIEDNERAELRNLNQQYENDGNGLLNKLHSQYNCVEKVTNANHPGLYKTVTPLNAANNKVRYFEADNDDNKIYELFEVTTTNNGNKATEYVREEGANPVTAEEIADYNATVTRINEWHKDKVINLKTCADESKITYNKYPIFYATGATSEYYTIKDGKFYHIVNAGNIYAKLDDEKKLYKLAVNFNDNRQGIYLDDIDFSSDDLEEVTDINEIKSAKQAAEEKRANELKDVAIVEGQQYSSLKDIAESNEEMDKISMEVTKNWECNKSKDNEGEPQGQKGKFGKVRAGIQGYFWCATEGQNYILKYYKYDSGTGTLKYLEGVSKITPEGYMVKNDNSHIPCAEVFMENQLPGDAIMGNLQIEDKLAAINSIQEYGLSFAKIISGGTNVNKYPEAYRKLSTIIAMNDPFYTINFIKGYQANTHIWTAQSEGMFKQMYEEEDQGGFISKGDASKELTIEYYVKEFANLLLKVVAITGFDRNSNEGLDLEKIARGELVNGTDIDTSFCRTRKKTYTGIHGTALRLDEILKKIIEAYDKKFEG